MFNSPYSNCLDSADYARTDLLVNKLKPMLLEVVKEGIQQNREEIDKIIPKPKIFDFGNDGLTFGDALTALKDGGKVTRSGWNSKEMYLELQRPDEHGKMKLPYIYIKTADNQLVPWVASQTDLLAEDWEMV